MQSLLTRGVVPSYLVVEPEVVRAVVWQRKCFGGVGFGFADLPGRDLSQTIQVSGNWPILEGLKSENTGKHTHTHTLSSLPQIYYDRRQHMANPRVTFYDYEDIFWVFAVKITKVSHIFWYLPQNKNTKKKWLTLEMSSFFILLDLDFFLSMLFKVCRPQVRKVTGK